MLVWVCDDNTWGAEQRWVIFWILEVSSSFSTAATKQGVTTYDIRRHILCIYIHYVYTLVGSHLQFACSLIFYNFENRFFTNNTTRYKYVCSICTRVLVIYIVYSLLAGFVCLYALLHIYDMKTNSRYIRLHGGKEEYVYGRWIHRLPFFIV